MKRRKIVKASGVGIAAAVAGCVGPLAEEEEDNGEENGEENGEGDDLDEDPSIEIVQPEDSDTVGSEFTVEVNVENFDVRPPDEGEEITEDAGHVHIIVDEDPVDEGLSIPFEDEFYHLTDGETSHTVSVDEEGEYEVTAQLGDDAHTALPYWDSVAIQVDFEEEEDENGEEEDVDTVTVSLDADGNSSWILDSTEEDSVGEVDGENVDLTLEEGVRYEFENPVHTSHPLAFRNDEGEALLSQSGEGTFEDDEDVNWVDNDDSVVFSVTSDLADELDEYYCTVHAPMVGGVNVEI